MAKYIHSSRLEKIASLLAGRDEVTVQEMAEHFGVTPMTIRRDLDTLSRQGRVMRTHGGAMLAAPAVAAFEFMDRRTANPEVKRAIAEMALQRIEPGMTLLLDTGTTTLELARLLGGIPGLTVVTSSLAIASVLFAVPEMELILLGGTVNQNSPDLHGALTVDNLQSFHADLAFLGADGANAQGFYTSDLSIAQVSRAIIVSADSAVLLIDSSKFGAPTFARIAGWNALAGVVTDSRLRPADKRLLKKYVKDVGIAKSKGMP
jgi:DeoR/GlpR family transcriptional regulator of sugar metabolism